MDGHQAKSSTRSTETFGLDVVRDGGAIGTPGLKWIWRVAAVLVVVVIAVLVVVLGQR